MIKGDAMKRIMMIAAIVIAMPLAATACGMGEETADGYENAALSMPPITGSRARNR